MPATMGDVRRAVALLGDRAWRVRDDLGDDDPVPDHHTGADLGRCTAAAQAPAIDLAAVVGASPASPPMHVRRRALGLVADAAEPLGPVTPAMQVEAGAARPRMVDWRTRWGGGWLATIQDQNPCYDCWAFAGAALVETIVRIEHGVWSKRSEGDLRDGWGEAEEDWLHRDGTAPCAHGAGENDALDFVRRMGIADPGCYAFVNHDQPYAPTPDRSGRTVRIAEVHELGDVETQKRWIDAVGPLAAPFDCYDDFKAVASEDVYHKSAWEEVFSKAEGHIVLIVGYDDDAGCWIIRNSWGTGWGNQGYGRFGYGECRIDEFAKYGVQNTDPDPWTRRNLHGGCLVESGNGRWHRNFEMVRWAAPRARHVWRAGGEDGDLTWRAGATLENPDDMAAGVTVGYPTLISTTFDRHLECVHREPSGRLRHWWREEGGGPWNDGGPFGPDDVAGYPGFVQGRHGAPGNFEVVVRTADGRLNHWYRDQASHAWNDGGRFAAGVRMSGPSLVQSRLGASGNLDLVCVLDTGHLQHWWRDEDQGMVWRPGTIFGEGVGETPVCMIEGEFGRTDETKAGNFELCVAVDGRVQHWWRDNSLPPRVHEGGALHPLHPEQPDWHFGGTFGHDVRHVWGLIQGSFGFDLEVIVERTDSTPQHYWRDGAGWHEGPIVDV
jgi:hypothetical protein